jgi:hypothetical protein
MGSGGDASWGAAAALLGAAAAALRGQNGEAAGSAGRLSCGKVEEEKTGWGPPRAWTHVVSRPGGCECSILRVEESIFLYKFVKKLLYENYINFSKIFKYRYFLIIIPDFIKRE